MPILFVLLGITLLYLLTLRKVVGWDRKVVQIFLLMLSYFLPLLDMNGVVGVRVASLVALLLGCSLACDWIKVFQWVLIISIVYLCIINYNYLYLSQFSIVPILIILLVFFMCNHSHYLQKSTILAIAVVMIGVIDTYYMRRLAGYSVVADTSLSIIVFYMMLLMEKGENMQYDANTMQIKI